MREIEETLPELGGKRCNATEERRTDKGGTRKRHFHIELATSEQEQRAPMIKIAAGVGPTKEMPADARWTKRELVEQTREWLGMDRSWTVGVRTEDEQGEERHFEIREGWTYRLGRTASDSWALVPVTIIGKSGRMKKHKLGADWTEERVRAEIATELREQEEESDGVQVRDNKGAPREWKVEAGWTYAVKDKAWITRRRESAPKKQTLIMDDPREETKEPQEEPITEADMPDVKVKLRYGEREEAEEVDRMTTEDGMTEMLWQRFSGEEGKEWRVRVEDSEGRESDTFRMDTGWGYTLEEAVYVELRRKGMRTNARLPVGTDEQAMQRQIAKSFGENPQEGQWMEIRDVIGRERTQYELRPIWRYELKDRAQEPHTEGLPSRTTIRTQFEEDVPREWEIRTDTTRETLAQMIGESKGVRGAMVLVVADTNGMQRQWDMVHQWRYMLYRKERYQALWPLGIARVVMVTRNAPVQWEKAIAKRVRVTLQCGQAKAQAEIPDDTTEADMKRRLKGQFGVDEAADWKVVSSNEAHTVCCYEVRRGWTYRLEWQKPEATEERETEAGAGENGWGNKGRAPPQRPEKANPVRGTQVRMECDGASTVEMVPDTMTEEEMRQKLCGQFGGHREPSGK
jgi:hypothetical protein